MEASSSSSVLEFRVLVDLRLFLDKACTSLGLRVCEAMLKGLPSPVGVFYPDGTDPIAAKTGSVQIVSGDMERWRW